MKYNGTVEQKYKQKRYMHVCFCFLSLGSHILFVIPHEYRILVYLHIQKFRKTQKWVQSEPITSTVESTDTLEKPLFPFESEFAFNEERQKYEWPRTLSYAFLFTLLPWIGQLLMVEKGDTEGKGKVGQRLPTFSLSYSLLIRHRILIECAYIKKRNLKAELFLCSISTVLVRMKYIHTYDL